MLYQLIRELNAIKDSKQTEKHVLVIPGGYLKAKYSEKRGYLTIKERFTQRQNTEGDSFKRITGDLLYQVDHPNLMLPYLSEPKVPIPQKDRSESPLDFHVPSLKEILEKKRAGAEQLN